MIGGSVAKAHQNIAFTTSYIKTVLKLPLTKDELAMEKSFKSMRRLPKARK